MQNEITLADGTRMSNGALSKIRTDKKGEKAYEKNILYGTQRGTSGRERACLRGGGIAVYENTAYLYGKGRTTEFTKDGKAQPLDVPMYIKDGYVMLLCVPSCRRGREKPNGLG